MFPLLVWVRLEDALSPTAEGLRACGPRRICPLAPGRLGFLARSARTGLCRVDHRPGCDEAGGGGETAIAGVDLRGLAAGCFDIVVGIADLRIGRVAD